MARPDWRSLPLEAVLLAYDLRSPRRTLAGKRKRSWRAIRAALAASGWHVSETDLPEILASLPASIAMTRGFVRKEPWPR